MPAVTVVGSLNLDIVVGVDRLPGRGETVVGSTVQNLPGGKGANQAAAAAALGADVAMVGRVGADAAGTTLLADLRERGVDVTAVATSADLPTGTATVAVERATGENLIVVAPGANAAVSADDVRVDAVRQAQVVLVQLEVPIAAVAAAVDHARGIVVLNPAPPADLSPDLLARVDVLVPNEQELVRLAGRDSDRSPDSLAGLARTVTARDVVITLGSRGALVVPADGPAELVPAPGVDAVDTTGAGDCFCGALAVALAEGRPLAQATRLACAAAATSTTGEGARGALPLHFAG
jgi:ribokinase